MSVTDADTTTDRGAPWRRLSPRMLLVHPVRELGRFIKNHGIHTFDELGARAPVEVGAALFRTVAGPRYDAVQQREIDTEEFSTAA